MERLRVATCNKTIVKYNENLMSLFRRLDDVSSFMSTVDLFADSPQGGWGGNITHSAHGGWLEQFNFMSRPTGGIDIRFGIFKVET